MKKILFLLFAFCMTLGVQAQFDAGTRYVGASLSGLNLSYNKTNKFSIDLSAHGGYYVMDNLAVTGLVGFQRTSHSTALQLGAGGRYNITQNGLYLGAGVEFDHFSKGSNDLFIPVEIGYTFYLNHFLAVEPALYYKTSLFHFSDNSTVGFKLGLGYYF